MEITYRALTAEEAKPALLAGFDRYQNVTRCWRKVDGAWVIRDIAFTERWDAGDILRVCAYMRDSIQSGGAVYAAFDGARLAGYAAVRSERIGSRGQYVQLRSLQVTRPLRGRGIGKRLFFMACGAAKRLGAEKLYISGQSSVETQAFYRAVGCAEAQEYHMPFVEDEPCDCQLERDLADILPE